MSLANEPQQQEPESKGTERPAYQQNQETTEILRAEVDAIHAFIQEYKTSNQESARIQWKTFWITLFTALVVTVYTTITALQWSTLLESNRINREALTSVQRAYVSFKFIESLGLRDPQGKVVSWQFFPQWENSGTTPTKIMRHHVNANWFQESLPDGFGFQDLETWDRARAVNFFLLPRP